jgi:predicted site-specific integrase-resolvase
MKTRQMHVEPLRIGGDEFLMSVEVARWLRVSPATLCRWRQTGRGPRVTWMSASCPRYKRSDVEAWLAKVAA